MLFFAPLGASFFLYYGAGGWRPGGRVNHGDLVDPARPLPEIALPLAVSDSGGATRRTDPHFLQRKWTLLYVGPGDCPVECRTRLYDMRQVRVALNRDMDRVQRVFIAAGNCCDWDYFRQEHPDLITIRQTQDVTPLLATFPSLGGIAPQNADRVYLIDPLGNLMMIYAPDAKAKGILQDIKRLLGLSSVG